MSEFSDFPEDDPLDKLRQIRAEQQARDAQIAAALAAVEGLLASPSVGFEQRQRLRFQLQLLLAECDQRLFDALANAIEEVGNE